MQSLSVHSEPGPASSSQVDASAQSSQAGSASRAAGLRLQASVVHAVVVVTIVAFRRLPALQVSSVHASPSPHCAALVQQPAVGNEHRPVLGLQASTVQKLLSSHSTAAVGCWQTPFPSQVRMPLQRLPSSQLAPGVGVLLQVPALQARAVHGLPSSGQSVGCWHCAGLSHS
jgi:hypothetical protein